MSHFQLHEAIKINDLQNISEYISQGIDLSAIYDGFLPIGRAITHNQMEVVKLLVSRGADPNPKIETTPLILCVKENHLEIAKYLLEVGANACAHDNVGRTPLSWALEEGHVQMMELLLEHGAEFTIYSALMEAIERNQLEMCRLLIKKCPTVNFEYEPGMTPLLKCLKSHNVCLELVEALIDKGADVNKVTSKKTTPLMTTIQLGNLDLAKLLLKGGADVNVCVSTTPLIKSIQSGDFNLVKEIISYNANVNQKDDLCNYPVTKAIEVRNFDMLHLLLEKGASLDITDKNGDCPFIKSVRLVNFNMVNYLIGKEIDVNKKDSNGETALSIALSKQDFRTFDLLVKSGGDVSLAKNEIEEMVKKNRDFAIYFENLGNQRYSQFSGNNGHEDSK